MDFEEIHINSRMAIIGILLGIGIAMLFSGKLYSAVGSFIIGFSIASIKKYI